MKFVVLRSGIFRMRERGPGGMGIESPPRKTEVVLLTNAYILMFW